MNPEKKRRNNNIFRAYIEGNISLAKLGKRYGLRKQTVHAIVVRIGSKFLGG